MICWFHFLKKPLDFTLNYFKENKMDELIRMLADDKGEKFYLTEEEEKEMLENLPEMEDKFENILLEW